MFINPGLRPHRFTGNPPQQQQAPQQTRKPAPIYPQGVTPSEKKSDKKPETKPETAPVPVPDFSTEAQRQICPFQKPVSVQNPQDEKLQNTNANPQQNQQPVQARRSGCGSR